MVFHYYNDAVRMCLCYSICTLPILLLMQTLLYLEQFTFYAEVFTLNCLSALFELYMFCAVCHRSYG